MRAPSNETAGILRCQLITKSTLTRIMHTKHAIAHSSRRSQRSSQAGIQYVCMYSTCATIVPARAKWKPELNALH
ncbi:hypothetical protein PILCRDRAFT_811938 [Piloderma croceum F 1598]|uniref:Uncharacterized protein n=1 Tax=Piloderma croceum (strain F 1598) TaxID=765440 RepID=A0A0C3G1Q6_PILCF|nr:hypothetical protein PILCRDRAFT_811938 [Piloderma croceum F 1598]